MNRGQTVDQFMGHAQDLGSAEPFHPLQKRTQVLAFHKLHGDERRQRRPPGWRLVINVQCIDRAYVRAADAMGECGTSLFNNSGPAGWTSGRRRATTARPARRVCSSMARYTSPMPPQPRRQTMRYRAQQDVAGLEREASAGGSGAWRRCDFHGGIARPAGGSGRTTAPDRFLHSLSTSSSSSRRRHTPGPRVPPDERGVGPASGVRSPPPWHRRHIVQSIAHALADPQPPPQLGLWPAGRACRRCARPPGTTPQFIQHIQQIAFGFVIAPLPSLGVVSRAADRWPASPHGGTAWPWPSPAAPSSAPGPAHPPPPARAIQQHRAA